VRFSVNPSVELALDYPPATPFCSTEPRAQLGDYVWVDINPDADNTPARLLGDGLQNDAANEPGVAGVTVELWPVGGVAPLATTTTAADGTYEFVDLMAGEYYLVFINN